MHRLQEHILGQLSLRPVSRYRDLKPKEIEGNQFMYHLRQLFQDGLIEKTADGYRLSPQGLAYADKLSFKDFRPRLQPKIVVMITSRNEAGEWLLYKRLRQPFSGQIGFPYGKIHLGETIVTAAKRELAEKSGLTGNLTHKGEAYVYVYQGKDLVGSMFAHIFVVSKPTGALTDQSFWAKIDDPDDPRYLPGFREILELVQKTRRGRFFREIVCQMLPSGAG